MDEIALQQILLATNREERSALVSSLGLTLESVQFLKDHSATYLRTDPTKALEIARVAYEIGEIISPVAKAYGGWSLANALIFTQEYQEAEGHFLASRRIFLDHELSLDAGRMSIGLVYVWAYLGKNAQALDLAKAIEERLQAHQTDPADQNRLVNLLMNVCTIHELQGQYEESVTIGRRLLKMASNLDDSFLMATLHHNMAHDFAWLNSFQDADKAFQTAEKIFRAEDAHTELSRLYINRLALLLKMNDLDTAKQTLTKAQSQLAIVDSNLMSVHRLVLYEAQLSIARESIPSQELDVKLKEARHFFAEHGPHSEEGLAWLVTGERYLRAEEINEAQYAFQQARQIASAEVDRSLTVSAIYGLARVLDKSNKPDEALTLYEEALTEIERIRQRMQADLYRSSFLVDKLIIYQDLARLYISRNALDMVYHTTERARSRLIAERLLTRLNYPGKVDSLPHKEISGGLASTLQENMTTLDALYQQVDLNQIYQGDSSPDRNLTESILQLEEEINRQIQTVQMESQLFSPLAVGAVASLEQVQSRLHCENLFYYHIIHNEIWVFVVTAQTIVCHQNVGSLGDISSLLKAFALATERAITLTSRLGLAGASAAVRPLLNNVNGYLQQLHEILLKPLMANVDAAEPLIVSAEGLLNTVPFHALFDGTTYLIERMPVCYVPSGTVLEICLLDRISPRSSLLMGYGGDDLAAVDHEIDSLVDLLSPATIYLGEEATAEHFLAEAPHCGLIHLATHARFRADNSMLSYLALADRNLFLAELSQLRLQAELVVLSGCETGAGQNNGSDLLSLASAFFGAGARSLLVSLWRVEDQATSLHMETFYTHLSQKYSKIEALRMAQLSLIERGRNQPNEDIYQHPAFWAPFVLLGNWK